MIAHTSPPPDALAAALARAGRIAQAGARHRRSVTRRGRFDWRWQILDEATSPHTVLASGRAWSKARAWVRLERAYALLLERIADGRAES